ncbi:hypothetical protein, partial [Methylobacterium sp. WL7]|uniref:hypothetical protein n=1 Tax=Methylobacterium sp. WL7 TaxID=2603900 RepID=UPI001AED7E8A
ILRQLAWLIGIAAEESFWEWYVSTYGAASAIKEATQAPNISQLLTAVIDERFGIGSEPIITDLADVKKLYSAL